MQRTLDIVNALKNHQKKKKPIMKGRFGKYISSDIRLANLRRKLRLRSRTNSSRKEGWELLVEDYRCSLILLGSRLKSVPPRQEETTAQQWVTWAGQQKASTEQIIVALPLQVTGGIKKRTECPTLK